MATATNRLDQALVDRGLVETRSRAQSLIMAGHVFVDDRKETKPGTKVKPGAALLVQGADHPWVSRGGLKLQGAIDQFGLDPTGAVAIDVGASTGGFTDVLLTRGAVRVYAVDVGHGQLAWKLRQDERVVVLEKLNARYLIEDHVPEPVDWVVCDASFIGLRTVLPAALSRLKSGGLAVALIKPQFEVGKGRVSKGGIVREPELHAEVVETISGWFAGLPGVEVAGVIPSPIKGPDGNVEFLIVARFTTGGAGLFTQCDPGKADGDAAGVRRPRGPSHAVNPGLLPPGRSLPRARASPSDALRSSPIWKQRISSISICRSRNAASRPAPASTSWTIQQRWCALSVLGLVKLVHIQPDGGQRIVRLVRAGLPAGSRC